MLAIPPPPPLCVKQAERSASLKRMSQEGGCVMVCTDAAARGLDLPGISHVVQADFALSAIDFLHRVGHQHSFVVVACGLVVSPAKGGAVGTSL